MPIPLLDKLDGPLPALPRPVDRLSEHWARLPPRMRLLIAAAALLLAVGVGEARVTAAEARWGGSGVQVLVAVSDLSAGSPPEVEPLLMPSPTVPPGAVADHDDGAVLSMALPEGSVLTETHLEPAGPAAGLAAGQRVVPLPVESAWALETGGWVDVWVLGLDDVPASLIAERRPVLGIEVDERDQPSALVALSAEEVAPVTAGIANGRVLVIHAPRP